MTSFVGARVRTWPVERAAVVAAPAVVGVVAALACLPGARHFALWQDEIASARVVSSANPLAAVAHTESTPPLWYALAWFVHRCGVSVVDLRLLSVAAAVALAAGTAAAARRVVPWPAASLAGAAVALGWQFDFHGRELRAYELAALLTLALAVAAPRGGAALAAVVAAGSLTHYFFLFSVLAVLIWRPRAWRAVAAGLVPLAVWSPLLLQQYGAHRFAFIGAFDLRTVAGTYWLTFVRGEPGVLLPSLLLAAVAVGALVLARTSDEGRLWALLATVPVATAATLWLVGVRIYDVRNLIGCGPFAAVAVASLLARRSAVPVGCAVLVVVAAGWARSNRAVPVPYDQIAAALVAEGWDAGAPIAVYGNVYAVWGPLEWYLPRHPVLVLTEPSRGPAFVVAARGPHWAWITRHADELTYVRGTLVARIASPPRGVRALVAEGAR